MKSYLKNAHREAYRKAGGYDGRFANKRYTDRRKERERTFCRKDVSVPLEDEAELEPVFEDSEGPSEYNEEPSFRPFADLA